MGIASRQGRAAMMATTAFCAIAGFGDLALAQEARPANVVAAAAETAKETAQAAAEVDEIVVVGSQIQGAKVTAALPVSVISTAQIAATATTSGDELFRTIPQLGNVTFNSTFTPGSSNSARGDVNSVSLRNLGAGNTLVLLNGRRTVPHPITQGENTVPTFTYNSNAIPVAGLKRLEVLRDGGAAIYGTDAVAGVINTVLQDDYHGGSLEFQYGAAEGTHMKEGRLTGLFGTDVFDGRGNFTIFGSHERRSALLASDQDYTALADLRPLFAGTEFADAVSLDGRSTTSAWGVFQTPTSAGTIRVNGVAVTGPTGLFHIAPQTNPTCGVVSGPGICIDVGAQNTTNDRNLRLDPLSFKRSSIPQVERYNLFSTFNYQLNDKLKFFSEFGYYNATSHGTLGAVGVGIATATITIPANSYYNPFGPTLLANGQPNPNRLAGLSSNVPAAGLPITINTYGLVDAGDSKILVKNDQWRFLGGLKGSVLGFNWESAALYSFAKAEDTYNALSATKLYQALARTTPDAYNPFNGGTVGAPSLGDGTPSSDASLADLKLPFTRTAKTSLAQWDMRLNKADLLTLWSGDVGVAMGVEIRRDKFDDDRDARIDGTSPYTDPLTGLVFPSDVPGASSSPDVHGKRTVASAYAELAIPLVSPEMNIPLVDKIELQVAGRAEHYSDVGSIAKPKIAGAWDVIPGIRFRGSWSQGFRAPNLEQINTTSVLRNNGQQDYIFCEADLRARRIANFNACSQSRTTKVLRAGNKDLQPETSTSLSYGIVFEPEFLPPEYGRLTLTADIWKIKQKLIIGTFGSANALVLDYLMRVQGGANPLVHRLAPTPEQAAMFVGTGIAPIGQVDYIDDQFVNQNPQVAQGIDLGAIYRLKTERFGDFSLNADVAKMQKLYQAPAESAQVLLTAKAAGTINASTPITGGAELVGQNGNVKWRGSGSFNWRYQAFAFTWFANYTGKFYDTALTYADGSYYRVKDTLMHNVSVAYTFEGGRWENSPIKDTRIVIGARNVFDKDPPLTPTGYNGAVYNPYGRYLYFNIRKTF
jgi:outer membrane receptor protein involved in Fe transport